MASTEPGTVSGSGTDCPSLKLAEPLFQWLCHYGKPDSSEITQHRFRDRTRVWRIVAAASGPVTPRGQGYFSAILLAIPSRLQDGVHHTSHPSTVSAERRWDGERVHLLQLSLFIRKSKACHMASPPAEEAGKVGVCHGAGRE